VGSLVTELTSQLSNYHTYLEQRMRASDSLLSPVAEKFSAHLKENAKHLRGIDKGYKDFQDGLKTGSIISLETIPSLCHFSNRLEQYVNYLQKLAPYTKLVLDEENSLPSCGKALEAVNCRLVDSNQDMKNVFLRLNNLVHILSQQSKRNKQHPRSNLQTVLTSVIENLEALHTTVADLFSAFEEKTRLESEVPSSSEKLNSTNSCIVNALVCLVSTTKEFHTILAGNKSKIIQTVVAASNSNSSKSHPVVIEFKSRASSYLKGLEEEEPQCVPYEEALKHKEESTGGSKSREVLGEQLVSAQKKTMQLEQDKEHWKQEYQLLHMKHTKERQRSKELELQLSFSGATTPQSEDSVEVAKLVPENQEGFDKTSQASGSSGPHFSFVSMVKC